MALQTEFSDRKTFVFVWIEKKTSNFLDQTAVGEIDSWSTGEQFARELLLSRGISKEFCHGWSVTLEEDETEIELMGYDYVLDLISELEIPPCSPVCKSFFLVHDGRDRSSKVRQRRKTRTTVR